jgi:hypothetical protein
LLLFVQVICVLVACEAVKGCGSSRIAVPHETFSDISRLCLRRCQRDALRKADVHAEEDLQGLAFCLRMRTSQRSWKDVDLTGAQKDPLVEER